MSVDLTLKIIQRAKNPRMHAFLTVMATHRPITHDFGNQRDPDNVITCTCKQNEYNYSKLDEPYFIHLFDVLEPHIKSMDVYDGR